MVRKKEVRQDKYTETPGGSEHNNRANERQSQPQYLIEIIEDLANINGKLSTGKKECEIWKYLLKIIRNRPCLIWSSIKKVHVYVSTKIKVMYW